MDRTCGRWEFVFYYLEELAKADWVRYDTFQRADGMYILTISSYRSEACCKDFDHLMDCEYNLWDELLEACNHWEEDFPNDFATETTFFCDEVTVYMTH